MYHSGLFIYLLDGSTAALRKAPHNPLRLGLGLNASRSQPACSRSMPRLDARAMSSEQ